MTARTSTWSTIRTTCRCTASAAAAPRCASSTVARCSRETSSGDMGSGSTSTPRSLTGAWPPPLAPRASRSGIFTMPGFQSSSSPGTRTSGWRTGPPSSTPTCSRHAGTVRGRARPSCTTSAIPTIRSSSIPASGRTIIPGISLRGPTTRTLSSPRTQAGYCSHATRWPRDSRSTASNQGRLRP